MKTLFPNSLFGTMALLICFLPITATQAQVLIQDPHNHHAHHDDAHAHHWNYQNAHQWGDVEVNKLCKLGQAQSPINITRAVKPANTHFDLQEKYQAQNFTITNNGHTIVFDAQDSTESRLNINGIDYELLQFHYHIPSEHTVMNRYYPLELHFVHRNMDQGLAVIGVLVDKGDHNADLEKILTNLPTNNQTQALLKDFNVATIMPKQSKAYAYQGSLTTPPCGEQVQWLLKNQTIHASTNQLAILSALYDGNNRPIQPQGERTVYLIE